MTDDDKVQSHLGRVLDLQRRVNEINIVCEALNPIAVKAFSYVREIIAKIQHDLAAAREEQKKLMAELDTMLGR